MLIPYGLHESIAEAWKKVILGLDWENWKKNLPVFVQFENMSTFLEQQKWWILVDSAQAVVKVILMVKLVICFLYFTHLLEFYDMEKQTFWQILL